MSPLLRFTFHQHWRQKFRPFTRPPLAIFAAGAAVAFSGICIGNSTKPSQIFAEPSINNKGPPNMNLPLLDFESKPSFPLSHYVASLFFRSLKNWNLTSEQPTHFLPDKTFAYKANGNPLEGKLRNHKGIHLHAYIWLPHTFGPNQEIAENSNTHMQDTEASQNQSLQTLSEKQEIKGIVIIIHGFNEHCRGQYFSKPHPQSYRKRDPTVEKYPFNEKMDLDTPFDEITYHKSWIEKLNKEGYIVAGFDLEGHGLSEGLRCAIENADSLALDVIHFIHFIQTEHAKYISPTTPPTFLIGTSMGGWVCARALQLWSDYASHYAIPPIQPQESIQLSQLDASSINLQTPHRMITQINSQATHNTEIQDEDPITQKKPTSFPKNETQNSQTNLHQVSQIPPLQPLNGVVLISPMLDLERRKRKIQWDRIKYFIYPLLYFNPNLWLNDNHNTRYAYPYLNLYRSKDPLSYHGGIPLKTFTELFSASERIHHINQMSKLKAQNCPAVLIIHNGLDPLVDIKGSMRFLAGLPLEHKKYLLGINVLNNSKVLQIRDKKNSSKIDIDHLHGVDIWHNIPNEPGNTEVFDYLLKWIHLHA